MEYRPTDEDLRNIAEEHVCAECGGELEVRRDPETGQPEIRCTRDQAHRGYVTKPTAIQTYRRGESVPAHIEDTIRKAMLPGGHKIGTALAIIKMRFPAAALDEASAALFINDCLRLDLDPLLGEIVPATFKVKDKATNTEHKVVQPLITEDGWLSMAARGCRDRWIGAPTACRLEDRLRKENEGKAAEEIDKLARAVKKDICGDELAHVWVAWGKVKVDGEVVETPPTYGWFRQSEKAKNTPGAELPGNQARVRAINRWVRENFPDAKKRMMEMTAVWLERGKDVAAVRQVIDAEYRIIMEPKDTPPGEIAEPGQSMPAVFRTWGDVAQLAHDCGISQDDLFRRARVKKWADFPGFDEAVKIIQELSNERAHKPRML
ncbi:MAG: hypothetical protein WC551_08355 [Patescibacteria group bacterium]